AASTADVKSRSLALRCPGRARGRQLDIDPLADVRRKPRHAVLRQLLVTKANHGTDLRRRLALGIRQPGADAEPLAAGELDHQRADPALVLAGTWRVVDHPRLGVLERLHLEQRRRPADDVVRSRLA